MKTKRLTFTEWYTLHTMKGAPYGYSFRDDCGTWQCAYTDNEEAFFRDILTAKQKILCIIWHGQPVSMEFVRAKHKASCLIDYDDLLMEMQEQM